MTTVRPIDPVDRSMVIVFEKESLKVVLGNNSDQWTAKISGCTVMNVDHS